MPLSAKQICDPDLVRFSETANRAIRVAAEESNLDPDLYALMEVHAGRVVDEITALLFRLRKVSP